MREAITHLNYIAVVVTTIAGFLLGWLWYGMLFGKLWMAEMKITPEKMEECRKKGMAVYFVQGLLFTLLSTFGLAVLLASHGGHGIPNWKHGAAVGAFVGVFIAAARLANTGTWEEKSCRLRLINGAHEVALFTIQGAILALWR
jgi:xanthine/uracil/vitamin C permease (AzgA family)